MGETKAELSDQIVSDKATILSVICLWCTLASWFYLCPVWKQMDEACGRVERKSELSLTHCSNMQVEKLRLLDFDIFVRMERQ